MTFITINESDIWRKVDIDQRFCVVCFAWPDSKVSQLPAHLRVLFRHVEFATKRARMGKVVRVSNDGIRYYTHTHRRVIHLPFQGRRPR